MVSWVSSLLEMPLLPLSRLLFPAFSFLHEVNFSWLTPYLICDSKRNDVLPQSTWTSSLPWYGQGWWYFILCTWLPIVVAETITFCNLNRFNGRLQGCWVEWGSTERREVTLDTMSSSFRYEVHLCCILSAIWYSKKIWRSSSSGYIETYDDVRISDL